MNVPPPLNAIRVFAVAAKCSSFKKAAEKLHVTPGAVSRQIQGLEDFLGVPLFVRGFREVLLTEAGQLYFAQVGPALDLIDQATRRTIDVSRRAVVRVETTPTFAMYWLIPRLGSFQSLFPDIEVKLTTAQGVLDRGRDVDLFVRRDVNHFGGLDGEAFMTEWSVLVCSPRLPNRAMLPAASAVAEAPRISMRSRSDLWPKWFRLNELSEPPAGKCIEFDNTILAIQAAIEALGIALVPRLFLDAHLDGGTLVCLPELAPFASGAYHLLLPRTPGSTSASVFIDWLRSAASG
jgi:LysR family transcriptional regulator, glycine cleavage system transcriptional activator